MASKSMKASPQEFAEIVLRAFARELKSKPKNKPASFFTQGWVGNYQCSLCGDEFGFALVVMNFNHREKVFRSQEDIYVMIRPDKPEPRHGKAHEVKAVKKILGMKAFRVVDFGSVSEEGIVDFCRRHSSRLKQLELQPHEDIGITSESIRFRWVETDPMKLRPRLEGFARLIDEVAGTSSPTPEPKLFEREWRLKRRTKSNVSKVSAACRFGGTLDAAVACPECDEATNLIAELDLSDRTLPKTALGLRKVPIFSCLACLGWGPNFYDISGKQPKPLTEQGRSLKQRKLSENGEELPSELFELLPVAKGKKVGLASKIGGLPRWLQNEEMLSCPKCRKSMAFLMQIASNSQVTFGDMGLLYAFVCPKCKIVASLIQSY